MMRQRALGRFVVIASMLGGCVAEPDGLRTDTVAEGSEDATGGQPSETSPAPQACEALRLLEDRCGRCHGAPPENGAPFSLTSLEDLSEVDAKGRTRRARAAAAIERGDMPALFIDLDPPVQDLDDDEQQTLLAWLRDGDDPGSPCD